MTVTNYCANDCEPANKDPRYKNIIEHVRKMNSLTIRNVAIAGEGPYGLFSGLAELTFLKLSMENNTYHPHLYHYSVGVSIGAVIIVLILNARYLYEMESTQMALDYLNAILDVLSFDSARSVLFDIGNDKELGDFDPLLLFKNILVDGAFCQREQLIRFLQGTHKNFKFNNTKRYFTSKEYFNWLQSGKNLENIFIVCYSLKQTKMCVYTGNKNRFLSGVNYIDYELLTYDNLIEAVLGSSAIVGLYPQTNINRDKAIDGASAEVNQFVHLQILINVSYYISSNLLYTPELQFFGITPEHNDKFTIIVNKINIQNRYENIIEFYESSIPLLTTMFSLLSVPTRLQYNTKINVPLTSMFLTQPFIKYFSVNNITKNILGPLSQKQRLLYQQEKLLLTANKYKRIPTFLLSKQQFKADIFGMKQYFKNYKEYKRVYHLFNPINSNLMLSTHLYCNNPPETIKLLDTRYNEQTDENGNPIEMTLNISILDQFVRHTYDLSDRSIELELLLRNDKGTADILKNLGIITANIMYDIHTRQSLSTYTTDKVTCNCIKPFISDIKEITDEAYRGFLGPNQS